MKRYNIIFLLSIIVSVCLILAGCSKDKQPGKQLVDLIPEDITKVAVTHIRSGKETKSTIEGTELEELKLWSSNLSMEHKIYNDGSTPGDVDGGEVYSFNMDDNYTDFSYIINGKNDCYLLIGNDWYVVSNPSAPFDESKLESTNKDDYIDIRTDNVESFISK